MNRLTAKSDFESDQHHAGIDRIFRFYIDGFNHPVASRGHGAFHFHGLDDHPFLAPENPVTRFDFDFHDETGHGAFQDIFHLFDRRRGHVPGQFPLPRLIDLEGPDNYAKGHFGEIAAVAQPKIVTFVWAGLCRPPGA